LQSRISVFQITLEKNRKDERFIIAHMHIAKLSTRLIAGHINRSLVLSAEKCEETKGVIVLIGIAWGKSMTNNAKLNRPVRNEQSRNQILFLKNKPKWSVVDN